MISCRSLQRPGDRPVLRRGDVHGPRPVQPAGSLSVGLPRHPADTHQGADQQEQVGLNVYMSSQVNGIKFEVAQFP